MLLPILGMFFLSNFGCVPRVKKVMDCTGWEGKCNNAKLYLQAGGRECHPYILEHCNVSIKDSSKKNKSGQWGYDNQNMPPCNSGYKAVKINPNIANGNVWDDWETCKKKYSCKKRYRDFSDFKYYYQKGNESERHRPGWRCSPE